MKTEMEANPTNFWNLSKKNTRDGNDFFATRDINKHPLNDISFASNIETKTTFSISEKNSKMESNDDKGKKNLDENGNIEKNNRAQKSDEGKDEEFCLQLVSLNTSVLDWIKQHIEENPCIDLTPVIKDYEKHLQDIEAKYEIRKEKETKILKTPEPAHPSPVISTSGKSCVTFISSTPIPNIENTAPKIPAAGFFASPSLPSKPLVSEQSKAAKEVNTGDVQDEDAPPAVERKTVVEEDAFHQIRCKLFFKKGSQWQELGIGMLYLKPCDDKIQLLVRMEAVTGKVLLNILVSKEIPVSRSGKNNLMIVSVPNPPVYAKATDGDNSLPCTYLIRVKGATEADELLTKLKPTA